MSQRLDTVEGRKRLRRYLGAHLALQAASYPFVLLEHPEWRAAAWSSVFFFWIIAGIPAIWAAARTRDFVCAAIGITSTLLALPGFMKLFQHVTASE